MVETVELLWGKSLLGYALREPTSDETEEWAKFASRARELFNLPGVPPLSVLPKGVNPARKIIPMGSQLVPYYVAKDLTQNRTNIVEAFINASHEGVCEFANRFGPLRRPKWRNPEPEPESWNEEQLMKGEFLGHWLLTQMELRGILKQAAGGGYEQLEQKFFDEDLGQMHVRLIRHAGRGKPHLRLEPDSLVSFIVLQAAVFIAGGAIVRGCRECSNLMIVGGGSRGYTNREVCSHRCRMAAHRRNQKARSHPVL